MIRLLLILAAVTLTACGAPAQDDRNPELTFDTQDTSHVTVWRNIDKAPNVITFCAEKVGWVVTLNSGSDGDRGTLQRFFDKDIECGTHDTALDDQ